MYDKEFNQLQRMLHNNFDDKEVCIKQHEGLDCWMAEVTIYDMIFINGQWHRIKASTPITPNDLFHLADVNDRLAYYLHQSKIKAAA